MSPALRPFGRAVRRGFTLIELLMVVTIILLLAGVFLSIRPGNGGGLPAAQKMLGSTLQSVRAMALMNRGSFASNVTHAGRYRLLILKDENDPENHLRQFCIAVGSILNPPVGVDLATIPSNHPSYVWYAPEAPSVLPPNVFFIPPATELVGGVIAPPENGVAGDWGNLKRRSILPRLADTPGAPITMSFEPINQPRALPTSGRTWYFVELQPSGASNHLGKVVLVVASGVARVNAEGKVVIDCDNRNQFAALSVRPNGSVSYTSDPDELDPTTSTIYPK